MPQQLWYLTKNGQSLGPFSAEQLKEMAAAGLLEPADLLWTDGWNEWKRVSTTRLAERLPPPPMPPMAAPLPPVGAAQDHHGRAGKPEVTQPTDPLSPIVGRVREAAQQFGAKLNRKKTKQHTWVTLAIALGSMLLLFVFLGLRTNSINSLTNGPSSNHHSGSSASHRLGADKPDESLDGNHITVDFLPHKVGAKAHYTVAMPAPIGEAELEYDYQNNGIIDVRTIRYGDKHVDHSAPQHCRKVFLGCVDVSRDRNNGFLVSCLKLGATVGDTWTRGQQTYKVKSFGTYTIKYDNKPRPCVVIEEDTEDTCITDVFVKGIGLVTKDGRYKADYRKSKPITWRLNEENERNMTASERAFFE